MAKSTLQRLVDSGLQISEMSRQQAESVVRQLVQAGEVQRRDAEELVQRLLEMGRETTVRVAEQVEAELLRQLRQLSARLDAVESRLESLTSPLREDNDAARATGGDRATPDTPAGEKPKKGSSKKKAKGSKQKSGGSKKGGPQRARDSAARTARPAPPPPAPAVGASGVRRIATTRAARDAD